LKCKIIDATTRKQLKMKKVSIIDSEKKKMIEAGELSRNLRHQLKNNFG
jgi:hypothetical protein